MSTDREAQARADSLTEDMDNNRIGDAHSAIAHATPNVAYEYGPLQKTEETTVFERLTRRILRDRDNGTEKVKFSSNDAGEIIATMRFTPKGKTTAVTREVNVTQILPKVNFNHLNIDPKLSKVYAKKYDEMSSKAEDPPTKSDFEDKIRAAGDDAAHLRDLSYSERLAIHTYTSEEYNPINAFLRGQHDKGMVKDQVGDIILHAAMASVALNKVPDIEVPDVIRGQDEYGLEAMKERVKGHEVSQESAFISTSNAVQEDFEDGVKILYKNVYGKNVAAISAVAEENEYLIPPSTQLKWTGYEKVNGEHVFTVRGSNVQLDRKHELSIKEQHEKTFEILTNSNTPSDDRRMDEDRLENFACEMLTALEARGQITNEDKKKYLEGGFEGDLDSVDVGALSSHDSMAQMTNLIAQKFKKPELEEVAIASISDKGREQLQEQLGKQARTKIKKAAKEYSAKLPSDRSMTARETKQFLEKSLDIYKKTGVLSQEQCDQVKKPQKDGVSIIDQCAQSACKINLDKMDTLIYGISRLSAKLKLSSLSKTIMNMMSPEGQKQFTAGTRKHKVSMASRRMVNNLRKAFEQSTSKSRRTAPRRQHRHADQGMSI